MTGPRIGSLCSGYGGLEMAMRTTLGGEVAWHAEIDPAASKLLAYRHPGVPNHGDITAIDWSTVEPVDYLTAGFPCQDVSLAGSRKGMRAGTRSGIWSHVAEAINHLRPRLVLLQNVRGLLSAGADSDLEPCPWCLGDAGSQHAVRALGVVLGDLADLGFDARWCGLRAADVGAPHGRYRIFIAAWPAVDAAGIARRGSDGERVLAAGLRQEGPAPAEDADVAVGGERRLAAPGQAEGRRSRADARGRGRASAADAAEPGREGRRLGGPAGQAAVGDGAVAARPGLAVADADGERLAGWTELHSEPLTGGVRPLGRDDPHGLGVAINWGSYAPAIHRWEAVCGRSAPAPTITGARGNPKLNPAFVEWMMGLPAGWVTDVPGLSVNDQLKMLGNGVVPQQAAAALRWLLAAEQASVRGAA